MKRAFIYMLSCYLTCQPGNLVLAQSTSYKAIDQNIMLLLKAKHEVEQKGNEAAKKAGYSAVAAKIKSDPGYLSYLNTKIAECKDELTKRMITYCYVSPLSSIHLESNMINHWQYLKVVRYSIFEVKADTLLSLDKVPFMREAYLKEVALEQKRSAETVKYLRKRSIPKP